jgi:hypothetical protein
LQRRAAGKERIAAHAIDLAAMICCLRRPRPRGR